jgi:DNA mismatch repair protein MutS2
LLRLSYHDRILIRRLNIPRKRSLPSTIPPARDEVHLRRLTVDEAMLKLDRYLNNAFMSGLIQVKVIHGKGTGVLRQMVIQQLPQHPLVKSFRPAEYSEGGSGVTIVELERK